MTERPPTMWSPDSQPQRHSQVYGSPPPRQPAPPDQPPSGWRRLFNWRRPEEGQQIRRAPQAPLADPLHLSPHPDPQVARLIDTVRMQIPGPRVIAFINPKGGAHKTTASVLTAASFGVLRRRGVLAWDDNELRGTLGLRAGTARHGRTIKHLLQDLPQLEATGGPYPEELDAYLRRQDDGCFDVLASDEDPRIGRLLTKDVVHSVTNAVSRSHQVIIVDTGNNIDSDNWRTVVERADQLVVITLPREDAAFAADWMLELLVEDGYAAKVEHAVTVFSTPAPEVEKAAYADLASHFASRTRAVIQTPYDAALDHGGRIDYHSLSPQTRDAWVRVAAVIAQGL